MHCRVGWRAALQGGVRFCTAAWRMPLYCRVGELLYCSVGQSGVLYCRVGKMLYCRVHTLYCRVG